jgi:hypothetical protein
MPRQLSTHATHQNGRLPSPLTHQSVAARRSSTAEPIRPSPGPAATPSPCTHSPLPVPWRLYTHRPCRSASPDKPRRLALRLGRPRHPPTDRVPRPSGNGGVARRPCLSVLRSTAENGGWAHGSWAAPRGSSGQLCEWRRWRRQSSWTPVCGPPPSPGTPDVSFRPSSPAGQIRVWEGPAEWTAGTCTRHTPQVDRRGTAKPRDRVSDRPRSSFARPRRVCDSQCIKVRRSLASDRGW